MPSGAAAMAQPCWTSGATGVGNPSAPPWGETPGEGAIGRGPVASGGLTAAPAYEREAPVDQVPWRRRRFVFTRERKRYDPGSRS
jgi:hypothetical protein